MRVMVIGAKGMLGQATLDAWFDHDVLALDLPQLDITDPVQVKRIIANLAPQVVINCAAYTDVDGAESHYDLADRVNGIAVGYLAQACDAHRIPLVHISTDYVFDGTAESGYRESDQPKQPVNAYGQTKLHGEQQLLLHVRRFYLVRTSWLYGPGGKNFVGTMLQLGRTKPALQVVNDQHGKPTLTRDLAGFIKKLVVEKAPYGTYHGVNEGSTTWYDFTREIFRQAGINTPVEPTTSDHFSRPAKRPAWSVLLNLKRPPSRPWTEALASYLAEID